MPLEKKLGFLDVFAVAVGAMISSGLFVLPALAYARCGPGVFAAYSLAALFILPAMLSQAELGTAMPKAGGSYFFIDRSLGTAMGSLAGISNWFSLALKSAFALVGVGVLCELFAPGSEALVKAVALGFLGVFVVLNIAGVELAGRAQAVMVAFLLAILGVFIVVGAPRIDATRFVPLFPHGPAAMLGTAGMVFVSYGGLTKVASIAEETRNPVRTIPLAMITSWFLVSALYVLAVFVTVGVLDSTALNATAMPLAEGARVFMGSTGLILLAAAQMLAVLTTANSGIMAASRTPMAMARDGLVPRGFGRINSRFGTPHVSVLFTGAFMAVAILALDLEHLVEAASALMILLFVLVNLCVIVMRESGVQNYRPSFRSPLYPWIQVVGIVGPLFLLVEFGVIPLAITLAFALVSLAWYLIYARRRTHRESGLVHLVERLVSRHLSGGLLREELRDIVMERDDVVEDRIDKLVKDCPILDLEGAMTTDDLFHRVAETLAKDLSLAEEAIYTLLWERERDSSTALSPGLAVPHVIVDGDGIFDLVLVRARDGVTFDSADEPVTTVFVLIGSRDERNFHLKTLAAIAQIVQNRNFFDEWLAARGPEELRDIILLAERTRHN